MKYLYHLIIYNKKTCLKYLKESELLPTMDICIKEKKNEMVRGSPLKHYSKNSRKRDSDDILIKMI